MNEYYLQSVLTMGCLRFFLLLHKNNSLFEEVLLVQKLITGEIADINRLVLQ